MTVGSQEGQKTNLLQAYPDAHLLQSPEWAEFKSHFGWQAQVFSSHPFSRRSCSEGCIWLLDCLSTPRTTRK